jgi:hypothetical protein
MLTDDRMTRFYYITVFIKNYSWSFWFINHKFMNFFSWP